MKNIVTTINESIWDSSKNEIRDLTWKTLRYNSDKYESRLKELEEYSNDENKFTDNVCKEIIEDILQFIFDENKHIKSSVEKDCLKQYNSRSKEDKKEIQNAIISGIDKFIFDFKRNSSINRFISDFIRK